MTQALALSQFEAALQAVESETAGSADKAEMLMEIAMGLQMRPKSGEPLVQAVQLYRRALTICPADSPLLRARITMRMGTALQALPDGGTVPSRRHATAMSARSSRCKAPAIRRNSPNWS